MPSALRPWLVAATAALLVAGAAPAAGAVPSTATRDALVTSTASDRPVELHSTLDSFESNGDGTYDLRGSLHLAASDAETGLDLSELSTLVLDGGEGPDVTVLVEPGTSPSPEDGYTIRRQWAATDVALDHGPDVRLGVGLPRGLPLDFPYDLAFVDRLRVDTVQFTVTPSASTWEISYLRGAEACPATVDLSVTATWRGVVIGARPEVTLRSDGPWCRGRMEALHGSGPTAVSFFLREPSVDEDVVIDLVPRARTLRLDHSTTPTTHTVTARASRTPTTTLLEVLRPEGRWVEVDAERQTARRWERPTFTIERTAQPVQYRVRVLEDAAGAAASSPAFTVEARTRPAAQEAGGLFPSRASCEQVMATLVDTSDGEWNGYRCESRSRFFGHLWYLGTITYTP